MTPTTSFGTDASRNGTSAVYQRRLRRDNPTPPAATNRNLEHLLSAALAYTQLQLLDASEDSDAETTRNARKFLESLGFSRDHMRSLGFGVCTSAEGLARHLNSLGFSPTMIACSGLFTDGNNLAPGAILAPLYNVHGVLVDLAIFDAPRTRGAGQQPRFVRGIAETGLAAFGFRPKCNNAAGQPNFVIVENLFDAWWLQASGIEHALAIGGDGAQLSAERWERLYGDGIERTTLVLDSGDRWYGATRHAVENALHAHRAPEIRVVNPSEIGLMPAVDYVRRHGTAKFRTLLSAATRVYPPKDYDANAHGLPAAWSGYPWPARYNHPLRESLLAVIETGVEESSRAEARALISELDRALRHGDVDTARRLVDAVIWRSTPEATERCQCESLQTVLDRLTTPAKTIAVPEELSEHRGQRCEAGQSEWTVCSSPRQQLAAIADHIADALATPDDHAVVALCRHFTADQILFALVSRLVQNLSDEYGLSAEEIHDRLTGAPRAEGYSDKPWLVDEAIDCLRGQTEQVTFITGSASVTAIETELEAIHEGRGLHAIISDSPFDVPSGDQKLVHERWSLRFGCAVFCIVNAANASWPAFRPARIAPIEVHGDHQAGHHFRRLLSDWIQETDSRP